MRIRLIQPRELFGPPERQEELKTCWAKNDGLFDSYAHPAGQPFFNELFDLCHDNTVNVIANSDIYFDRQGIELIRGFFQLEPYAGALSRWDIDPAGVPILWNNRDSQDVWVFFGKPRNIDAGFRMGIPGCDNHLCWLMQIAGYKVINPAKTIKCYHLHQVQWRSYLVEPDGKARGGDKIERVPGPYAFVMPAEL